MQNVTYNIVPMVYGLCKLGAVSASLAINPDPKIIVSVSDSMVCRGESTVITVTNPNTSIRGQWIYDLKVTADEGITGNSAGGTFTSPTDLNETLTNNDTKIHKVVYLFTPRIKPDDGGTDCGNGKVMTITIWVYPRLDYSTVISDFNGYNISCYGNNNGFIRITASDELAPIIFNWTGPRGFVSSAKDIESLFSGQYSVVMTDRNNCTTTDNFNLIEPGKLSMTFDKSVSSDGSYNLDCAGDKTASLTVTAINGIGQLSYLWNDGITESGRTGLGAGTYGVIITDANNCQADSSTTLTEPDQIVLSIEVVKPYCPDKPDGEIKVTPSGGIPGNGYTYVWSDNSTESSISNILPGIYFVTVKDENQCAVDETIKVKPEHEICLIIPDAFSPNGDLKNDLWNIGNSDLYPEMEITIFNRWGQMVWKSNRGYTIPWDGRSKGKELPIDAYHYVIDIHNGSSLIIGAVTIVR